MSRASLRVLAALLSVTAAATACASTEASPDQATPWSVMAADSHGAVLTDGVRTIGISRDGTKRWQHNGQPSGISCVTTCPNAVATFPSTAGPATTTTFEVLAFGSANHRRAWPQDATRILAANDDSLLYISGRSDQSKLHLQNSRATRDFQLAGDGLWFPASDGTTGIYVDPSAQSPAPTHYVLAFRARTWKVTDTFRSSSVYACASDRGRVIVSADHTTRASAAHTLSTTSPTNCITAKSLTIGISSYLEVDAQHATQSYIADVKGVHKNGRTLWSTQVSDYETIVMSPSARTVALVDADGVEVLSATTGVRHSLHKNSTDAFYTADGYLVTTAEGAATWHSQ